jgi:hypothetical protein
MSGKTICSLQPRAGSRGDPAVIVGDTQSYVVIRSHMLETLMRQSCDAAHGCQIRRVLGAVTVSGPNDSCAVRPNLRSAHTLSIRATSTTNANRMMTT